MYMAAAAAWKLINVALPMSPVGRRRFPLSSRINVRNRRQEEEIACLSVWRTVFFLKKLFISCRRAFLRRICRQKDWLLIAEDKRLLVYVQCFFYSFRCCLNGWEIRIHAWASRFVQGDAAAELFPAILLLHEVLNSSQYILSAVTCRFILAADCLPCWLSLWFEWHTQIRLQE